MVAIFTGAGTGFERGSGNTVGAAGQLGNAALGRSGDQLFLNAANGNLLLSRRDEFLAGRGLDLAVSRTYNSLGNFTDDNGDNWRQSTDRRVFNLVGTVNTAGSTVQRRSADGSEITYSWNGSVYVATDGSGAYDTLSYNGNWVWTDGDSRVTETYSAYGSDWRIIQQTDTSGNSITYSYSGANLYRATTADGSYVEYRWSGNDITSIVNGFTDVATGNTRQLTRTLYSYDGYNRLSSVTVDLSPDDNSIADGKVYTTNYSYWGATRLVQTISETDGSSVTISYDGSNRVASWTQVIASGVSQTTNIAYGAGYTVITDATGQATTLYYDGNGQLTQITAPPAFSGAAQQTVRFQYNGNGDLTAVTDANGATTGYAYDGQGNLLTQTDRLGNQVVRTYNAANQVVTESQVGSDKDSAAAWHTTRYVYDGANRLRFVVSADGHVTETRYDGYGEVAQTLDYTGQRYDLSGLGTSSTLSEGQLTSWTGSVADPTQVSQVNYVYDLHGNTTQKISFGGATSPGNPTTGDGYTHQFFTYDQAGQLLTSVVAGQNQQSYVYDGLGRVVASTDVNGGTTSFVFNDAATQTVVTLATGYVRTSTYNKAGDLIAVTEGGAWNYSTTSTNQYDQLGRLRISTDAVGGKHYYVYDKVGRKVADIDHYGWTTEYRYDQDNRLVATVRYTYTYPADSYQMALFNDPNSTFDFASVRLGYHPFDVWTWTVYDAEGRVSETIDGDGSAKTYDYDASGTLVRTISYANKLAQSQIDSFKNAAPSTRVLPGASSNDAVSRVFHDADGRVIGTLDGEGYLTRTVYDAGGRKVQETAYANATYAPYRATNSFQDLINSVGANAGDRTTRYVYDQQDNLRFVIDALGHVTGYGYDYTSWEWSAFGPVRSATQFAAPIGTLSSYTYASVKAAVAGQVGNGANRVSYAVYDDAGRLAYAIDAGGAVTGYSYDILGNKTRTVAYAASYAPGSLPAKSDVDNWAAANAGNGANRINRFYYAANGQLRFTIDAEGYVTRHDYDQDGREVFNARWDTPVAANDGWTIDTVNANAQGGWTGNWTGYNYNGTVGSRTDGAGNYHYYWWWANGTLSQDVTQYGTADESHILYYYDAAGHLIQRYDAYGTAEQSLTQFAYDGLGNLVSTTDPDGHTTSYSYDKLGRVISKTDAAGGVTSYQYDAFGDLVKQIDARGNASYNYYDTLGRVTSSRDAEDYVTETSYTVFGQVSSVTRRYNRANNGAAVGVVPTVSPDGRDATTSFDYDKLGRVTRTTDAENYSEYRWYDAFGNLTQVQNKIGGITQYTYDRRGSLRYEWVNAPVYDNQGNQTASGYYRNVYEYDARGNMVHQVEGINLPERRDTWFTYDRADRLIQKQGTAVQWLSQSDHASAPTSTPTWTYKYDTRNNLIETSDPNGARTLYYYDHQNRKIAEVSATGTLTQFGYDAAGNVTLQRIWGTTIGLPAVSGGNPPATPGGDYRDTYYSYDALNRLTASSIPNVRTGSWNGSVFALGFGTVTTSYQYDANGNIVSTTNGNGATVFSYYDRLGRKIAQVDQEGYVTRWTLDGEGNVVQERRYATQTGGASIWAQPGVPDSGADRITNFTYDRNGRRTTEQRLNVVAYGVSGGGLYGVGSTSVVSYAYNGLGEVTSKTQATGDTVIYQYDSEGKLYAETQQGYYDNDGNWTQPLVVYQYNALGNLVRTVQTAQGGGAARVTQYVYGAGGRLSNLIDPNGHWTDYYYDLSGNLLRQSYDRQRSDDSHVYDGILYTRDVSGRLISQTTATWNGSVWVCGDSQETAYNAYGEVSRQGINGGWQQSFDYDGMGQLWRTNSGDGVWRYFVHDGAGNRTATIESEGSWIGGLSLDQALAYATSNWSAGVGQNYIDGINATLAVYDRRGQQTQTILTKRQLSETSGVVDLNLARGYNAFGETAWERDARGNTTNYSYNTLGKLTAVQHPWVIVTNAQGNSYWTTPTEYLYYDASGRQIGQDDANGNRTTRALLAGTGYNGNNAQVTYEWHADGGVVQNFYDRFGDLRHSISEENRNSWMSYDGMGRLLQSTRNNGTVDYYTVDALGQRIKHWNSYYGIAGALERTDYDNEGRVVTQVAFDGETTSTSYAWSGGLSTAGLGTFGGWVQTTYYSNGRNAVQYSDIFDHVTYTVDLGGHATNFTYDLAARQIQRSGSQTVNYNYLNSGLIGSITSGYGDPNTAANNIGASYQLDRTTFSYDANGNKLSEVYVRETGQWYDYGSYDYDYYNPDWEYSVSSTTYRNASASYDAMNRMTNWSEAGGPSVPAASTSWSYDAVGNVRRTYSNYSTLDQNGYTSYASTQDYWYAYDAMNRVTTAKGQLINGQIVRGTGGTDYSYFRDGRRATATTTGWAYAQVWDPNVYNPGNYDPYDPYVYDDGSYGGYVSVGYQSDHRETYGYDADGNLSTVSIAESGYIDNGDGTVTATPPSGAGALKAQYWYDGLDRLSRQLDYLYDGNYNGTAAYDRQLSVSVTGRVNSETDITRQGNDTITSYISNDYGYGSGYALGSVVNSYNTTYKNGGYQYSATTTNNYLWYSGAEQSTVTYAQSGQSTKTSYYYYDANGVLQSVYVQDGRPRSITFTNDQFGQVIRRDEGDNNYNQGDPHEVWYRFNGKQLGYTGNNGTIDTDYQASINARTVTPGQGAFRGGATYGSTYADFSQSGVDPINSYEQGSGGGSYTVRTGDTLASIAQNVWGDASLWYKIAQANGLSAASSLSEGQRITLPSGVQRASFNASTLNPYDANQILGDTNPTTPTPQAKKKGGCGIFGAILLAIVAVGVAIVTAGAALSAVGAVQGGIGAGIGAVFGSGGIVGALGGGIGGFIGGVAIGAASAALGSIVSQGIGVATGLQDKFNWGAVGLAALGGGIGAGIGGANLFSGAGKIGQAALNGITANVLTQGIAVATGLQPKFDWVGVAAAGVGAAAGAAAGNWASQAFGKTAGIIASNAASGIANAATRSLISGTDFGDNILAALPDIIAQSLGNIIGERIGAAADNKEQQRALEAVRNDDRFDTQKPGNAVALAQALRATAKAQHISFEDVLGDDTLSNNLIKLTDQSLGLAERTDGYFRTNLKMSDQAIAATRAIVEKSFPNAYKKPDLSRPAELLGFQDVPEVIVTASKSDPNVIGGVLLRAGHFFVENASNPWAQAAVFAVGLLTAPVSTALFTAAHYTPGLGDALKDLEGRVGQAALGYGSQIAQAAGFSKDDAPYVAIGAFGIIATAALGVSALGLVAKTFPIAKRLFEGVADGVGGIRTAEGTLYNGITGPGPLGAKFAQTFRSGSYTEIVTSDTTTLYRVYGGRAGELGPFWTRTEPRGPLQSVIDSALDPAWGNNATKVVKIEVPRGVKIYEGAAAPQRGLVGGGNQVVIPHVEESWIVK